MQPTCSHFSSLQFLNREGRWGATDDFATSFLHFSLFSTAPWDLANSRPVHSLMLSSHLFLGLSCLLPPFPVPCTMVLARPDARESWPNHCSLLLFTMVRSSCGPIVYWTYMQQHCKVLRFSLSQKLQHTLLQKDINRRLSVNIKSRGADFTEKAHVGSGLQSFQPLRRFWSVLREDARNSYNCCCN